ncbi:MAG: hypothetical protein K2X84_00020 [Beijerinckiaceae bacterium]|nr:hypothetical protein [Beijerinckiaceae bacterium]
MLGADVSAIPAYNSNGLGLGPVDALPDEAVRLVGESVFSAIKIRLGREAPSADITAVEAVRAAVPTTGLMIDFNQALTCPQPCAWEGTSTRSTLSGSRNRSGRMTSEARPGSRPRSSPLFSLARTFPVCTRWTTRCAPTPATWSCPMSSGSAASRCDSRPPPWRMPPACRCRATSFPRSAPTYWPPRRPRTGSSSSIGRARSSPSLWSQGPEPCGHCPGMAPALLGRSCIETLPGLRR